MGCRASSSKVLAEDKNEDNIVKDNLTKFTIGLSPRQSKKILNGKSSLIRLDHCADIRKLNIKGKLYNYSLQYCYVSQRGYYPTSLGKANQDSYLVCETLLGDPSCNFFGVFDGHGEFGDLCSHYVAEHLSDVLIDELNRNGGLNCLDGPNMTDIVSKAHVVCNKGLEKSSIDDSLSGTTSISIIQKGDKLIVVNVGDSRAIIATEREGKLVFSPLSSDQTPYRKDERERLKRSGATIMTMDQLEGNEPLHENYCTDLGQEIDEGGDPPRVWDSTLERPGCAFSRSLGDGVAKTVGVSPEPEVLEWNIKPEDRFAVIASDGVFEFITSQAVVNMIQKYPNKLEAAKQVVAEAYRLWLTFDDRTDDITIIILIFDNIKPIPAAKPFELKRGLSRALSSDDILRNSRPVRKVMSRTKRKDIAENWSKDEIVNIDFDKLPNTKTDEEIARLSNMLSKSFMFEALSPIQKDHIFKVMVGREVKKGEIVIKEGEQGDDMYIVDKGQFLVYKIDDNGKEQRIFSYNEEGAAFGELSLMYGKPRAASVVAKTDGKLWSLGRAAFRAVMMRGKSEGLLEIYQTIPVLNEQPIPSLHRLCLTSKERHFDQGDVVINESTIDSCSWEMCVILTGVLKLIPKDPNKKRQLRAELSYFSSSEIGQVFSSAVAESSLKISCISKTMWYDVVGLDQNVSMKAELIRAKSKGGRLKAVVSPFVVEDNLVLEKVTKIDRFVLEHALTFIDDYGYFGNFEDEVTDSVCTIKVYAKSKVHGHRMEKGIVSDRNILSVLNKTQKDCIGLPTAFATYTDEKWAYLMLKDNFVSDLSMAISHNAIQDSEKPFLMACLYSAVSKVHSMGLIHRMINSSSCFITNMGVLKLADFRFAKRMDGAYCFTICGNPLYFAPEFVVQQGYDYGADLWAYGITLFELYEGMTPFGNNDTEETSIFRAISSFSADKSLKFTDKTPENARQLVKAMMTFGSDQRLGYNAISEVMDHAFFEGLAWGELCKRSGVQIDLQPSVELTGVLDDASVQAFSSPMFDKF